MSSYDYQLFVVGGGSGGVRAARVAASLGARVAIAERFRYGGTCVIRGCVPKKLLVYASQYAQDFEDAAGFGWNVPTPSFSWPQLIAAKNAEIARLSSIYERNLANSQVVALLAGLMFQNAIPANTPVTEVDIDLGPTNTTIRVHMEPLYQRPWG